MAEWNYCNTIIGWILLPVFTLHFYHGMVKEMFKDSGKVGVNCFSGCFEPVWYAEVSGAFGNAAFAPSFFVSGSAGEPISFPAACTISTSAFSCNNYHFPSSAAANMPVVEIMAGTGKDITTFTGIEYRHSDLC